jgi:hypothetical protein
MIVNVQDSGALEVFWRHHINRPFPRSAARDFLSRLTHHSDVLRLRHWLAQQNGCEPVRNLSDAAVIDRVATAISSGDLLAAENRFGRRWSGTGIAIGPLSHSVLLLPRRKLRPGRDLEYALEWLRTVTQPDEIQRLRAMLWEYERSSPLNHDAQEFYLAVEKFLRSGELIPVYHPYPGHGQTPLEGETPAQETPTARGPSEREEIVDAATFGSDHLAAAQISAMIAAAQDGIPFCEECAKARAQRNAT